MKIEIKKGLEENLMIYGVKHNHFWLLAFMGFGSFLFIGTALYKFLRNPSASSGGGFLITAAVCGVTILAMRIRFALLGKKNKHNFKNIPTAISNLNLLDYVS